MPKKTKFWESERIPENSDRKRVLNVLAQRRYRQRKKDRLASLEGVLRGASADEPSIPRMNGQRLNVSSPGAGPEELEPPQPQLSVVDYSLDLFIQNEGSVVRSSSSHQPSMEYENFSSELANLEISQFQFPDDYNLAVPELECINTACAFAKLLQCEKSLWDMTALRTVDLQDWEISTLPLILQPTPAQQQIPHHPVLDILPWPSVRSKLICVFSQPPELRPPNARDSMALVNLSYDLDDTAEGLKVFGPDRINLDNWEIGQKIFQNWWWAFDHSVIASSNRQRALRGAPRLQILPQ